MILPGMGVISELVAGVSRKQIFGYSFVAFSSLAIAILGFLVWGHHLFVSSQSIYAGMVFSIITMLVAVPSAVKTFNWTATMYKGSVTWESPILYCHRLHRALHDRRPDGSLPRDARPRRAPHRHVLRGRALPLHHGGRRGHGVPGRPALLVAEDDRPALPGGLGKARRASWSSSGFNLTFFPQFILGYLGMPRRYHAYPDEFQVLNVLSTAGASILGLGYPLTFCYLPWSLFKGERASDNPWGVTGLEWETTSPPPTFNFHTDPIVTERVSLQPVPGREATTIG